MKALVFTIVAAVALSGCATKRYGRAVGLSELERQSYTCREIDLEISKVEALQQQIAAGAQIDLASVAAWMADWGIGNAMERAAAEKTATQRKNELLALKTAKGCYG